MSKRLSSTGSFGLFWDNLSLGAQLLIIIAVISSLLVFCFPVEKRSGTEIWIFSRNHQNLYQSKVLEWNQAHPADPIFLSLLHDQAMSRRLQSGFFAKTPTTDLAEIVRNNAPGFFAGPLENIGFLDLTDRIRNEGLDKDMPPNAFSAWSSRGRIFGLPHDLHPVMLAYRHDLTEAAGINMDNIETWEDLFERMRPLQADKNGDGRPDRYTLSFSILDSSTIEALMLQAGGGLFDANEKPTLNTPVNAMVLSHIVAWCNGPKQVAAEAPEFSASGNRLKIEGFVTAALMPDWLAATWKLDLPQLSGKIRLIPLPAWKKGGLRTMVLGGTMMAIPKLSPDVEKAWTVAKYLYLSPETAEELYVKNDIITPVSSLWNNPIYDKPDPYFGGQAKGRLYIQYAPQVPRRTSSPFHPTALARMGDAALNLQTLARSNNEYDPAKLESAALGFLEEAQKQVETQMKRNLFINPPQ
jgi:arabinosaccharide transport system substrate-binding protein